MKEYVDTSIEHKTFTSFYTACGVEFLNEAMLDEVKIKRVMNYIFHGVKSPQKDYCLASYMIATQLASRVPLSKLAMETLIHSIVSNATEATFEAAMLCSVFLFQSQPVNRMMIDTFRILIQNRFVFPIRNYNL